MKPHQISKTNFQTIPFSNGLKVQNDNDPFNFQDFTVPLPMTQQQVEPPAYIWDKIAKVLDEHQHSTINGTTDAVTPQSFKKAINTKLFLYAAVLSVLGVLILSFV